MAISPQTIYAGQIDTSDPAYPHGKARNVTTPGDGTGTPFEERWVNDLYGFQQALLAEVGAVPSGNPDEVGASQYLDAVRLVGGSHRFDANGEVELVDADGNPVTLSGIVYVGANGLMIDGPTTEVIKSRGGVTLAAGSKLSWWDLTPRLSRSWTLVRVRVLVEPGGARGAGNRMAAVLQHDSYGVSFSKPISVTQTVDASANDDGTADLQWVTLTPAAPVAVSAGATWTLEVQSSPLVTGAGDADTIRAAVIEFTTGKLTNI